MKHAKHIIRNPIMQAEQADIVAHPLNGAARRRTLSLGDATGLGKIGMHINIVAPGDASTELHRHEFVDEFVYILSGTATVCLDDERHAVSAGDFIGLPARGPAHALINTGATDLVYLVGGDRAAQFDVCDYPQLSKRLYLVQREESRDKELVDYAGIRKL